MTRRDDDRPDFSTLDAGMLLPGCAIPIAFPRSTSDHADVESVYPFRRFEPLMIDGLSRSATRHLTDSFTDVVCALKVMHDAGCCYGRITSTSFHNRGSLAQPAATLWIDPASVADSDGVHKGDPESMYWTDARLQSGNSPEPADDWYALGIVLAELALSSASVHKIWELSRQDGKFIESLIKNVKRSRADKRLRTMAIGLIRAGAAGSVDEATVSGLIARRPSGRSAMLYVSLSVLSAVVAVLGFNVYRFSDSREKSEQTIAELQTRVEELTRTAQQWETAAKQIPPQPVAVTPTPPPVARSSDRQRWTSEIAGRTLEESIGMAVDVGPTEWRDRLVKLQSTPGQEQWRVHDPKLRRLIQMAVDAPWNDAVMEEAEERIAALGEAYTRWTSWARSDRSIDEIRTQHDLMPSGLVKEFLGQWLGEALEVRSFDITTRVAKAAEDNTYLAHRIGYETPSTSESFDWVWGSTDGSDESIPMQIGKYRAGDALSFWLQQDSSIPYWDSTVLRHTFDSPLLVWQLAKGLKLTDTESGYSVVLTTGKRFGPPVKLDAAKPAATEVRQRKEVDPMDELPFGLE